MFLKLPLGSRFYFNSRLLKTFSLFFLFLSGADIPVFCHDTLFIVSFKTGTSYLRGVPVKQLANPAPPGPVGVTRWSSGIFSFMGECEYDSAAVCGTITGLSFSWELFTHLDLPEMFSTTLPSGIVLSALFSTCSFNFWSWRVCFNKCGLWCGPLASPSPSGALAARDARPPCSWGSLCVGAPLQRASASLPSCTWF